MIFNSLKMKLCCLFIPIFFEISCTLAQKQEPIKLPAPQTEGGKPLMQALKNRQSTRDFSTEKIPDQMLSNLLWAANGLNRETKHTAPTALNNQEIDIYVVREDGTYFFDADAHTLTLVVAKDLRKLTGKQGFAAEAPLNLVLVANIDKFTGISDEDKKIYSAADAAYISQNIYLFCASEGLATVVRAYVDKKELAKALNLKETQKIIFAQTVGFFKK